MILIYLLTILIARLPGGDLSPMKRVKTVSAHQKRAMTASATRSRRR
jgi:hypothetical protein